MDKLNPELQKKIGDIAREHLDIQTLETRNSDRLDFHDVAVWSVQKALLAAVELGRELRRDESDTDWRRLAMQFDGHRMQALGNLRLMVQDPQGHRAQAEAFLSAGPLSGEKVLEERIKEIVAQMFATGQAVPA